MKWNGITEYARYIANVCHLRLYGSSPMCDDEIWSCARVRVCMDFVSIQIEQRNFSEPYFRFDKANHQLCHRETLIQLMWQLLKIYNRSKTNPMSIQYGQRFYHFHVYVFRRLVYFRIQRVLTTRFCYLFESIETNLSKSRRAWEIVEL